MDIKGIEDRINLRELVDNVSVLADQKDFDAQVRLFTENAVSETIAGGATILKLQGRKAMAEAFANFNKAFDTIYHFNGQQVLTLEGDFATGILYSTITLMGTEDGRKVKTTIGAIYQDEYAFVDKRWLIAKRIGTFNWQEKGYINQ